MCKARIRLEIEIKIGLEFNQSEEKKPISGLVGWPPFGHSSIRHQPQRPVPRGFPLFKRCECLVVNCNVGKQAPLVKISCVPFVNKKNLDKES